MKKKLIRILFLLIAPLIASQVQAGIIGFEELTDGTPIRDFYASQGVTFNLATAITAGLSLNEIEFPPYEGVNAVYDNTGPVDIIFATPTNSVAAFFTYLAPLQITAFDISGTALSTIGSAFNNNTFLSGDPGSTPNERLGFAFSSPVIAHINITGDINGSSFTFDNLSFSNNINSVPEPNTLQLFTIVAIMWFAFLFNRIRRVKRVIYTSSVISILAVAVLFLNIPLAAAENERLYPVAPSANKALMTTAAAAPVTIENIELDPLVIPNGIPTNIKIQANIQGTGIIPNGVTVQVINDDGRIIRSLGNLHDDGSSGDEKAMDGIFTGTFTLSESELGDIRLQISAAVKNTLLRGISKPFYIRVRSDTTVFNQDHDLWAQNNGPEGVVIYFGGTLSTEAYILRLLRSPHGAETWEVAQDFEYDPASFALPLFDGIDGSRGSFDYKLQVLGKNGLIINEFKPLTIPKYIDDSNAGNILELNNKGIMAAATTAPIANTAFITDAIMEDSLAMNPQQILDLLTEKGSFLRTKTLDDTYTDTNNTKFTPAQTIYDLAQKYTINPQMILVTMQKESNLVTSPIKPPKPSNGWMGAEKCGNSFQEQLECGVSRLRKFLDDIDTKGQTIGGWKPNEENFTCAGPKCAWEKLPVTPANRATAALWQYTPVVGQNWGGTPKYGGQGFVIAIWYPSLFKNLVNIIRWSDCGFCPSAPQIEPANPLHRGKRIQFGGSFTPTEDGTQTDSRHGLAGGLPQNPSYQVELDCSLNTWDSYNPAGEPGTGYWDVFLVNILPIKFWDTSPTDPISAPFKFGGEKFGDGLPTSLKKKLKLNIPTGNNTNFLNVLLDTGTPPETDQNFPSWGECTVDKVIPATKPGNGIIQMPK